jgi:hypothetical protein
MTKKTNPKKPLGAGMAARTGDKLKGRAKQLADQEAATQKRKRPPAKSKKPAAPKKPKSAAEKAQARKYKHPNTKTGRGGLIIRRP